MGEWLEPDRFGELLAIADEFHVADHERFAATLIESGLIVRERYYIPDAKELMGLMRRWSYDVRNSNGARWVMCRETHDALAERYTNVRVPGPEASVRWMADTDLPVAAMQAEVEWAMERARRWDDPSRLFGLPIRIDPAARSPLFELDSEATR